MSAHDEWRWTDERGVQRLVSTDELRDALVSGVIPGTTLVWCQGMTAWAPALEVPEFATAALDATHASEAPTEDDTVLEPPPAEGAPAAPEDAVTPMPAGRSPEKAGAAPFASRMARYRDAAKANEARGGSTRATPRASDKAAPAREPMRTLTGIEAPEKARPSASSPPIVVPSAGGTPEPGVARAITQVPRYSVPGGVSERDIPRAPKLPFAGVVPGADAAPEDGARHVVVDPLEVGWSLPPAAGADAGREQPAAAGADAGREQPAAAGADVGREQQAAPGANAGREQQAAAGANAGREQQAAAAGANAGRAQQAAAGANAGRARQAAAGGDAKAPARPLATRGATGATGSTSVPPPPRPIGRGAAPKPPQVAASATPRGSGAATAKAQDRPAPATAAAAAAAPAEETPAPAKAAGRPARFLPHSVPPPPVPVRLPSVPPRDNAARGPVGSRVAPIAHERRTDLTPTPLPGRAQALEPSGQTQAISPGLAPQGSPAAHGAGAAAGVQGAASTEVTASLDAAANPAHAASPGHAGTDPAASTGRTAAVLRRAAMSAAGAGGRADAATPLAGQVAPLPQGSAATPAADPFAAPAASPEVHAALTPTPLSPGQAVRSTARMEQPLVASPSQRPPGAATPAPSPSQRPPSPSQRPPSALTPAPSASTPPSAAFAGHAELDALDPATARSRLGRLHGGESWRPDPRLLKEPVQVPLLSLVGAGGALIFMVLMAFFVGRCSIADGSRGAVETAQAGLGSAPGIARTSIPAPPKPCYVARQPRRWAPLVAKSIPFDVAPAEGGMIAVGYARGADEAVGIEVDPATGAVTEKFSRKESANVTRVYPTPLGDPRFLVTTEGQEGLRSAVQVPATPPFVIGLAAGALSVADGPSAPPAPLWPLSGEEELEALRAAPAGAQGHAITFRRDKAVWGGWIGADRKPIGELTKVNGSGGGVGKPSSGWNGREIAVIFADRPADRARWEIRVGHAEPGKVPSSTEVIPLPDGGPGGDAFAPDIAGLPDGRWILVWTEGPPGSRAMRAQTLGPDFAPVGDPIALSPPAGNFGQGILGVSMSYVGAVFLSKPAASYELWGVILQCG